MRFFYFFTLFALGLSADIVGHVVAIPKSDTVTIIESGKHKHIRLVGIEILNRFKSDAKHELTILCLQKRVKVREYQVDGLGRDTGVVICEDVDANKRLISQGYALTYRKNQDYIKEMRRAQEQKRGMWDRKSFVKQYSPNFTQK